MFVTIYVFCLVLGVILLGASIIFGDTDAELDVDLDADGAADGGLHHGVDIDLGGADFFLWTVKSIRFWTFFAAFFGLTGLTLTGFGLTGELTALLLSLGIGLIVGVTASAAVRYFATEKRAYAPESEDYIGKTARVLVPIATGGIGKARLELAGTSVDVLATTGEATMAAGDEAMVIEMDGTTAVLARVERKEQ